MKKKDLADIRSKEVGEINKSIVGKKKELRRVVAEMYTGNEKNLKKARNMRRDIAQILTIIKEKELIAKSPPKSEEKTEK